MADLVETVAPAKTVTRADHQLLFEQGNRIFSKLFTYWMDTNQWSHPTFVALAKAALNGCSWLHSSQIAGLRHCNLRSPGPRTFIAIERVNYFVHRYLHENMPIPGTTSTESYRHAIAITEDGEPPPLGWWVEVFCGTRVPKDIDLTNTLFTEKQALELSQRCGTLIRQLLMRRGIDLITELDKIVWYNYTVKEPDRVQKLLDVINARDAWSGEEFNRELPALTRFIANLGGPKGEDYLLTKLKQ